MLGYNGGCSLLVKKWSWDDVIATCGSFFSTKVSDFILFSTSPLIDSFCFSVSSLQITKPNSIYFRLELKNRQKVELKNLKNSQLLHKESISCIFWTESVCFFSIFAFKMFKSSSTLLTILQKSNK